MTTSQAPYSETRNSGVESLGDLPAHWTVRRLHNTCTMRVSTVDKHRRDDEYLVRLCNYVDVYRNERIQASLNFMCATATRDEIERFRLQPGDVLITKDSELWNDIGVPALVESSSDDLLSGYHLALLRPFPKHLRGAYLFRALQSVGISYQFHVAANGVTRYGLSHNAIRSVWLPLPPITEQVAISRFLDHFDHCIQHLISAKRRLITLLEEQKTAMIHHAVTRGLDSTVRLVYSGVEWIGNVPEHWKIARLKSLMRNVVEQAHKRGTADLYVAMEHVESWTGRLLYADFDAVFESQVKRFRSGDILFGKLRPYLAKVTRPDQSGVCVGEFLVLRHIHSNTDPNYIEWLLRSKPIIDEINRTTFGAKMPRVNWSFMGGLVVAIPPLSEQSCIAAFLDRTAADLDAAVISVRREVSLLREYRTRLISDVVTGKLDVREAVDNVQVGLDASNNLDGSADPVDECVGTTAKGEEGQRT